MDKPIILMGDVHGEWSRITHQLKNKKVSDCNIIQVGDFGIGFKKPNVEKEEIKKLNNFLRTNNIQMFVIRGNHDDPSKFTFKGIGSNIILIPDGTVMTLNGLNFLMIGGATSIDRMKRITQDEEKGSKTWFEGEQVNEMCTEKIDIPYETIDYLITHTAPNNFVQILSTSGPLMVNGLISHSEKENDLNLIKDCTDEQIYLETIMKRCSNLSGVFCGHFHNSFSETINNVKYTLLNEHELKELRY